MFYRLGLSGFFCLLPLVLQSVPVLASEEASLPFAEEGNTPTVLSATRLQQSLFEAPAAVTVIDRQMIEQSGMREIPELLRLVPGMVVGYDTGSDAFVSFHGTSADLARRMQVLVDGRSIYQPLLASVDWIGLPLELQDIERIEVIRGPNSATWGANSFLAVINIITRHPADVERGRVSYRAGEDGVEDYFARLARRSGALDWRLTVAGRRDDGFEYNNRRHAEFTDSKIVDSAYGRGVWTVNESSSLEVSFGMAGMEAMQQYRPTFFTAVPIADRKNEYLSLAWEQDLGENNRLRLQASESRFRRDEPWLLSLERLVFHPALVALYRQNRECANGLAFAFDTSACTAADLPFVNQYAADAGTDPALFSKAGFRSGLDARERRTEVEVHDVWMLTPNFRTVFGVTFDEARVDSQVYLGGHAENTVWRSFAHAEWRFAPEWLLNVGGNHENDEGAGDYFSPRIALNWQFADAEVLRAVYSRAVRTPDILEDQANFGYVSTAVNPTDASYAGIFFQTGEADGNAPTERIESHELGYYGRFDAAHLTLDLRLFQDCMELVEHNLDPTDSEGFGIRPLKQMRMTGAEMGMDWRPVPSQRFQINYAYLDQDKAAWTDDNTHFVPQHAGSVALLQDYANGLQFGTTYAFYNDLRADRGFFFDRLENRLAKTLRLAGQHRLVLAAVMQTRLTDDPELREENGGDRHRGWFSLDWHY
ncbi:MAG: TonB-dependent receptor plug [Moraxellaceae bacterium]|jgi:iron complex outermembrane receptor protein|nr:TonB-dependent receptor plug [Moraxellaceae bacterium]